LAFFHFAQIFRAFQDRCPAVSPAPQVRLLRHSLTQALVLMQYCHICSPWDGGDSDFVSNRKINKIVKFQKLTPK